MLGQPLQGSEPGLGSVVVKVDEQVIENHRETPILLDEMFEGGETQSKV